MRVDPLGISEELRSDVDVGLGQIEDVGIDPRAPYPVRQGLRLQRDARRLFGLALLENINQPELSRVTIRRAIETAASATYWLEGSDKLTNAHYDLHLLADGQMIIIPRTAL